MRALKDRVHIKFPKESMTEQAHAEEVDINVILKRAMRGEHSDYIKDYAGRYGEATSMDFLAANIIVANANQMFDALPSEIRNRFQNKPEDFIDFVNDPANIDEMVRLKLANRPEEKEPPKEPPVQPTPPEKEPEVPTT